MSEEIELTTRPLTADQIEKILIDAHPRLAAIFGTEAEGLRWEPKTVRTQLIDETSKGRIMEDFESVRWGNGRLEFTFSQESKYYEGEPRLFTGFILSLIKPRVVGFGLIGTERPGVPITSVMFEWGMITDEQAASLKELFEQLLS